MAQIELEVRGKLNPKDFDKTLEFFRKKAKFVEEKDRLTLAYYRGDLAKDCRETKNEKVDLRIRITNKKAEIILKYGLWGAKDSRKEISVPIDKNHFDESVEMLKCLDWTKCLLATAKTFVFNYKGIEFAIVKQNNKHCYFEAEKLADNDKDAEKIHAEIENVCKELKLVPHTQEGFFDFINEMNNDVLFLDFNKDDWLKIKPKFKEFF